MTKIVIIGAGLSGLTAAHLLRDYADITIFEKSRSVGGRMSTRRAEPYFFDHGAQYFTAKTKLFQDFIQPLLDQNVIQPWNAKCVTMKGDKITENEHWCNDTIRYVGVPSMNSVAKFLAEDLSIHFDTKIVSLTYQDKWQLTDDQNRDFKDFDWVICTIPSPQALDLLPETFAHHDQLKARKMHACFALMLGFDHGLSLEFDSAHIMGEDLSWIAVNRNKPQRSGPDTLVVHSTAEYADAHIDGDREEVMHHLIAQTTRILGFNVSSAEHKVIHGWRYANSVERDKTPRSFIDPNQKLAVCGDWCSEGRVEGAFSSAHDLVQVLKRTIQV